MKNCCHFPLYWRGSLAVIVQFVLLVCEPSVVLATPLRTSLPTRIGLLENVVASKISSNLLKTPPRLTPTSIIVKGDGSVVVAGVSPATEVTVVGYDAAGREDWRTTIGNASSFNEGSSKRLLSDTSASALPDHFQLTIFYAFGISRLDFSCFYD